MPVLEAMACGAPVVSSNTAATPEIAGNAAAALLDPSRPYDHVEALTALLADPAARARFSTLGRTQAAHYTWTRSEALLFKEFKALL